MLLGLAFVLRRLEHLCSIIWRILSLSSNSRSMSLTPSQRVRASKTQRVLIKPKGKKALHDLIRQHCFRVGTDTFLPDLSNHQWSQKHILQVAHAPTIDSASKFMNTQTQKCSHGMQGTSLECPGEQSGHSSHSRSSTSVSLESVCFLDERGSSIRNTTLEAAVLRSEATRLSYEEASSRSLHRAVIEMGNSTSAIAKIERRWQAGSPVTENSGDTSSSPRRLPTPQNVSPLKLVLKRASASTLRLSEKQQTNRMETSPMRFPKLDEYSLPDSDHAAVISPVPQVAKSPAIFPLLSVSAPVSDSTVTQGTVRGHSPAPASLTLSPPSSSHALSPPLSGNSFSRPSSADSQKLSSIYSPFTRQQTPISIKAPPVNLTHFNCYQSHRRVFKLPNKYYPVPCMVCHADNSEQRWKCTWCCLRICTDCMDALRKVEGRNLRVVVEALQKKKENDWTAMGGQRDGEYTGKHNGTKQIEELEESHKDIDEVKKRRRMGRFPFA